MGANRMKTYVAALVFTLVGTLGYIGGTAWSEPADSDYIEAPDDHPFSEIISGYHFRSPETQALQDDDFDNPGFLWVDQGEDLWANVDGSAGKACASCHADVSSMKGVSPAYPKVDEASGKLMSVEHKINQCRTERMDAEPLKWESDEMLALSALVRTQSRGLPVAPDISGPAEPFFEQGKDFYYERRGQLDMACANCHENNYSQSIRSDVLSQGQSNGFPTYRLKWQKLGSLHRRFRGCNRQVRAEPFPAGSDIYTNLELYLAWRGIGLPVEAPSVRQ
jgi:sulfur-oxidizing protein SoxA